MKKIVTLLSLMSILAMFISACSSQTDEIYDDFANVSRSSAQDGMSDYQKQVHEIAKHIKFDTDSFYVDITLEDAIEQGISEEIYNKWLERLEVRTNEAREIISKGGKYKFVNKLASSDTLSKPRKISVEAVYGLYGGTMEYPDDNEKLIIMPDTLNYIGFGMIFSCMCFNKFDDSIHREVWYCYSVSGKDKYDKTITKALCIIGHSRATCYETVPFQGEIGEYGPLQRLWFSAELAYKEEGDYVYATCVWHPTNILIN